MIVLLIIIFFLFGMIVGGIPGLIILLITWSMAAVTCSMMIVKALRSKEE